MRDEGWVGWGKGGGIWYGMVWYDMKQLEEEEEGALGATPGFFYRREMTLQ